MEQTAGFLLSVGGILLLGLATNFIGKHTFLPRVTLLLLFGIAVSRQGFDLVPDYIINQFQLVTNMALLMLGFLLGSKFTKDALLKSGKQLLLISISAAVVTVIVVTWGLSLAGVPITLAILLGCIASATDPAATVDTITEQSDNSAFSNLLLRIVAIDDAWALIIFSIGLTLAAEIAGINGVSSPLFSAIIDIGGAIALGIVIGLPAAYLTGRLKPNEPMLTEALGLVFICGGLALWLEVSFLITAMVMGATIANLAKHHDYAFHDIENIESPLMIIFFVLAGASLDFTLLSQLGFIGLLFVLTRAGGKILGAWLGGTLSRASVAERRWIGLALMPQAGVAIGMALVAANHFPEHRQSLLTIVISTTVFFEIIGPICTRIACRRVMFQPSYSDNK